MHTMFAYSTFVYSLRIYLFNETIQEWDAGLK